MNKTLTQFLCKELDKLGTRQWQVLDGAQGSRVLIEGEWKISLCSNNYLGLADHPTLKDAAKKALGLYGAGTVAARSLSGSTTIHEELEVELAKFKGTEAALLFNSGFVTNLGVIPALALRDDALFSDELNHGSIVDGCRLSRADKFIYKHGDMVLLEKLLADSMHYNKRMVVADAVFSMDGDIAPIPKLVELCEKYDAFLMVDEAHATGVLGKTGRGIVGHFGLEHKVDVIMGTLGKALGAVGGYIAGSRDLIDYLSKTARSFLLTTSLPAMCAAAALAGLCILREEPTLRERLWENTNLYRNALTNMGFDTMNSKTPIVPIFIGKDKVAQVFSQRIYERGIYATKIGLPYVPPGTSRIRTIVTAAHTKEDIDKSLDILGKTGHELGII